MEVPAKVQALARQLGENLHQSEIVQAYLAADREFQPDIAARTMSERLVAWQDELIARQSAGELLSQADVDEFYALRQQVAFQPSAMKRQEALDDLKIYFMGISAELSQRLNVDYAVMVDHSHSQT
jgi:cell fate (sporulation/competence/biofilm development) regulator YlbF (YheA/YmcA/DUF963 family)